MKTYEELKEDIDNLTHEQMCSMWRFGSGNPTFFDSTNPASTYFKDRIFKKFGGFTSEISKKNGW